MEITLMEEKKLIKKRKEKKNKVDVASLEKR
jgi:hypothetical protein